MSDLKSAVFSVRLTSAILSSLQARAGVERRTVRAMAALLIEDGLARPRLAMAAPLAVISNEVEPRFKASKGRQRR